MSAQPETLYGPWVEYPAAVPTGHFQRTEAHRRAIGDAQRGDRNNMKRPEVVAKISGERGPSWRGVEASYNAIHTRIGKVLPAVCAMADDTCSRQLDSALRPDAPQEWLRTDARGRLYFVGPNVEDGYVRLCHSHHFRMDRNPA